MKASIIIPCRNMAGFVGDTVVSVLSQSHGDLELIFVDDLSTDGSGDVVRAIKDSRVTILQGKGNGPGGAFNVGLAHATGDIVMKCDADDLYPQNRLAFQVHFLERHPDVAAVSGYMSFVWTDLSPILECRRRGAREMPLNDDLLNGRFPDHVCAYAYRTSVLRKLGGIREYFQSSEDLDLLARLGEQFPVWHVDQHAYVNRLHDASLTRTTSTASLKWFIARTLEFQKQRRTRGQDDLQLGQAPPVPSDFPKTLRRSAAQAAAELLEGDSWGRFEQGDWTGAIHAASRAVWYRPFDTGTLKNLAAITAKSLLRSLIGKPPEGAIQS